MRSSRWSSHARSARNPVAVVLALFAVYAVALGTHATSGSRLTPAQAHVLLTADSIVGDRDLDLRDQYRHRSWTNFYGGELVPTATRDKAGRILEPQGVGLPLLLAPAYHAAGATGARLLCALLMAIAFACGAALARRIAPDPWATGAALVLGLSPPAVAAATAVAPEAPIAAALAGAAVLPVVVIALAMARWLRRRRRGLAGFAALEVVLTSAVLFITVNDRLYGGLTPYASRVANGPPTGLHNAGDAIDRVPRLAHLLGDMLRWAPFTVMALVGAYLLIRAHRERLAAIVPEHVNVEVVAVFIAFVLGAQLLGAMFLSPHLHGAWFPTRMLIPVLAFLAPLAAWGLRHHPRIGTALGGVTVALTVWMLVAGLWGDATLAPPHGFFFA